MNDWPSSSYEGTHAYYAGTGTAGTIDVPTDGRLRRVSVVAGTASATTVVIGSGGVGGTITVPAGYVFDEQLSGASINKDVVIAGGAPQSYYVSWVV